jgi:hypothetical protein
MKLSWTFKSEIVLNNDVCMKTYVCLHMHACIEIGMTKWLVHTELYMWFSAFNVNNTRREIMDT